LGGWGGWVVGLVVGWVGGWVVWGCVGGGEREGRPIAERGFDPRTFGL
jgi:hypothetical protein